MKKILAVGLGVAAVAGVCYAVKKVLEGSCYDCCADCDGCDGYDNCPGFDDCNCPKPKKESSGKDEGKAGSDNSADSDDDSDSDDDIGEEDLGDILDKMIEEAERAVDGDDTFDESSEKEPSVEDSEKDDRPVDTDKEVEAVKKSLENLGSEIGTLFTGVKVLTDKKVKQLAKREDIENARKAMLSAVDRLNKILDEATPIAEDALDKATDMMSDAVKAGQDFVYDHPELTDLMNKSVNTIKDTVDSRFGTSFDDADKVAKTNKPGDIEDAEDLSDDGDIEITENDLGIDDSCDPDDELADKEFDSEVEPKDGKDIRTDLG